MIASRPTRSELALLSLEAAAVAARSGFACMFSTSDEYESALIRERRARGHYNDAARRWPTVAFVGGCVAVLATVLLVA
jgi:hypothetical protein